MDKDFTPAFIIVAFGMIGIIVAAMTKHLYDEGIIIDELVTGTVAINDILIVIILWFLFMGIIIGVLKS